MGLLKNEKISLTECKITPEKLAKLIDMLDKGVINNSAAQEIFIDMAQTGKEPESIMQEKGLQQIGNVEELEAIIKEIVAANPDVVAQYKSGRDKLWGFFVGQAMQKTKGKGNPAIINDLFKKYFVLNYCNLKLFLSMLILEKVKSITRRNYETYIRYFTFAAALFCWYRSSPTTNKSALGKQKRKKL